MKLRNKKTGEIAVGYVMVGIQNNEKFPNPIEFHTYGSIAELNDEWEDYEPKEPLVEGRKQRAVLKAAARLSGATTATVRRLDAARIVIFDFAGKCRVELKDIGINIKNNGLYTITDICGEDKKKWRK